MSTSSFDLSRALSAFPFWEALTEHEREQMRACAQVRGYERGALIYSRDQECLGLIHVLLGTVRVFMLSGEGREIQLYQVGQGENDVLSASCVMNQVTFETQMVAHTACTLLIVPALCLSGFKARNVHVRCFLFEKLGERFSSVMHRMEELLFTRVDARVSRVLLEKAGQGDTVRITHEQLAREINSTREVVSRVMKGLERAGAVRLGRGAIRILDRSALLGLSDPTV